MPKQVVMLNISFMHVLEFQVLFPWCKSKQDYHIAIVVNLKKKIVVNLMSYLSLYNPAKMPIEWKWQCCKLKYLQREQ